MKTMNCASALLAALLLGASVAADEPMDHSQHQMDHSQHQGPGGHQMTPAQIQELRKKVPLYATYTDEQINESMSRMAPDTEAYLSPASVRGSIGVLGLGHGYAGDGNAQFMAGYQAMARERPTAVALGMAMMDSAHVQRAVSALEAAGARTIVVLPSETSETSSLVRQWHYMFGLRNDSAYLDVPRIRTDARVVMIESPTRSPIAAKILARNLAPVIKDPAKEVAMLIMHGPEDPQENEDELRNLARLAAIVKEETGLADVGYGSLQDDAPADIRSANVRRMREWIEKAHASGKTVLVEPVLLTAGGRVSQKLLRDLDGLTYTFVDEGMIGHPLFAQWVHDSVASAVSGSGN
jgi:hypothetical protein